MSRDNWNREDLEKVYDLYLIECNRIHKNNQNIIKLAQVLGKKVRGVENQLLMFRAVEKEMIENEKYGRKNYNKLVKQIYMERQNRYTPNRELLYPDAFIKYQKTDDSSVSRSDDPTSGRPFGEMIRLEIHRFVDDLLNSSQGLNKQLLFLIGGPGNGKTDTSQYIFDEFLKRQCRDEDISEYYQNYTQGFAESSGYYSKIRIENDMAFYCIQDATVKMRNTKNNYASLLEVFNEFKNEPKGLMLICINRGVLDNFINQNSSDELSELLIFAERSSNIMAYVDGISNFQESVGDFHVSTFPLDKSSLFELSSSIIKNIQDILEKKNWSVENGYVDRFNKTTFKVIHQKLGSLLFAYELKNNCKVTFREYFHLLNLIFCPNRKSENSILDFPLIRLWQIDSLENIHEAIDTINRIGSSKYKDLSNLVYDLKEIEGSRLKEKVLSSIQYFDPVNIENLWDTKDLYRFVTRLRDRCNKKNLQKLFEEFNELLEKYDFYGCSEIDLLLRLIKIYSEIETGDLDSQAKDIEILRKFVLRLIRNYLCILSFKGKGYFYNKEEFENFILDTEKSNEDLRKQLLRSLNINDIEDDGIFLLNISLSNNLWEYSFNQGSGVDGTMEIMNPLQPLDMSFGKKPKINLKFFTTQHEGNTIYTYVDYNTYLKLIELNDVFHDDLKRVPSTIDPAIKLWLNGESEKLVGGNFSDIRDIKIFKLGKVVRSSSSGKLRLEM